MQLEQLPPLGYEKRILRMRNIVISQPHEICIERARIITNSYKKNKEKKPIIRFAEAINDLLRNMTIKIWDDEIIVGNRCTKFVGTPLYPEVRVDTITQDLELYNTRNVQKFLLSNKDKEILKNEIIPYWVNEEDTVQSRFYSYLSPELTELMMMLLYIVDTNLTNGVGHFFPGHEIILKKGFNGLIQQVHDAKKEFSGDKDKLLFFESVIIVLRGAKTYVKRFSNLAKEMAKNESDPQRKNELLRTAEICSNISENPPKTFEEALQLVYFTHVIAGLEDGGFAISIGRLDQILYPFYSNDKKQNRIKDKKVKFLIECFYLKLTTLWNYILHKGIIAAEGPPIAQNLTIGGIDKEGNDVTNDLSFILLEAYKHLKTVQPAFSVRIHEKTPDDLILKTGDAIKSGASIALFNDLVMIKGLNSLGYSLEDAREYAPIGCVEPAHPYKSFGCTNATQFSEMS